MADYLVPMAYEMPDIKVAHVETPTCTSELGAKGAGEAGTGGAPAAILNAVNDAIKPFNAEVTRQPLSPEIMLKALEKFNNLLWAFEVRVPDLNQRHFLLVRKQTITGLTCLFLVPVKNFVASHKSNVWF